MNRDELVERVADFLFTSGYTKNVANARSSARAALAIIEPAVREECARVADVHAELYTNGSRQPGWGINVDAADTIASAIRAGAKP